MDDWLTFVFVECCQPTFPPLMPMKMALECGINLRLLAQPLPAGRRQIGHLVRDACANLRDQIGRIASASARNALTVRTAIRLLARLLLLALTLDPASREAPPLGERDLALISAYLAKVHSKQLRCKSALSSPAGPRELCIFPDGFTDLHVRTLIRQTILYLEFLSFPNQAVLESTLRYGAVICKGGAVLGHGAIIATEDVPAGVLMPTVKGTVVAVAPGDDRHLAKGEGAAGKERDFSIITPASKGSRPRLFLGPARFVNHDCAPNVKMERISPTLIGLRTIRPVCAGDEIYSKYGDHYFGAANANCLCSTCSRRKCAPPDREGATIN